MRLPKRSFLIPFVISVAGHAAAAVLLFSYDWDALFAGRSPPGGSSTAIDESREQVFTVTITSRLSDLPSDGAANAVTASSALDLREPVPVLETGALGLEPLKAVALQQKQWEESQTAGDERAAEKISRQRLSIARGRPPKVESERAPQPGSDGLAGEVAGGPAADDAGATDLIVVDLDNRYPEAARRGNLSGRALYRVTVDETGALIDLHLVESSGHAALDRSAGEMLRAARFLPARRRGIAVRGSRLVALDYRLR